MAPLALSSDAHVSGPQVSLAARAAIAYAGGEWASIVRPGAPGIAWQFRVLRRDGSFTDVLLDEQLELVDVGDSPSFATGYQAHASTIQLAHATATSSAPSDMTEGAIPQADYDKASEAALKATGGGRVHDVDLDRERGAMYEVEVITSDGRSVDVLLDANFKLIDMSGETDSGEPAKPGGHGRDDDDHHDD
jgi:hypothetical protein